MSNFDKLLPHCTVRLVGYVNDEIDSTGTGFFHFFNDTFTDDSGKVNEEGTARLGIVTNKHVVQGQEEMVFYFNTSVGNLPGYQKELVRVILDEETVIHHPESDVDLCVILAHGINRVIEDKGKKLYIYPVRKDIKIEEEKLKEMSTIQNLIMVGYPRGIWDDKNNLPIIRSGINATPLYENYKGMDAFAVDMAVYPGSSGSPVFIYDNGTYIENGEIKFGQKLRFVGVLSSGHSITNNYADSIKIQEMLHIGIAIKAEKLNVFEELIRKYYEG